MHKRMGKVPTKPLLMVELHDKVGTAQHIWNYMA